MHSKFLTITLLLSSLFFASVQVSAQPGSPGHYKQQSHHKTTKSASLVIPVSTHATLKSQQVQTSAPTPKYAPKNTALTWKAKAKNEPGAINPLLSERHYKSNVKPVTGRKESDWIGGPAL